MSAPHDRRMRPGRVRHPALIKVWRWRVAAAAEPVPLERSRPLGNAVLDALGRTAWMLRGSGRLPVCLHGPDDPGEAKWTHEHAFILPEDADGDGMIDHVSISARMGLDPAALRLLVHTDRVVLTSGLWLEFTPERAGGLDCAGRSGAAREWVSRTPYVPPNDRQRFDIKDAARQLRYEIGKRRLAAKLVGPPKPVVALSVAGRTLAPADFQLEIDGCDPLPKGSEPCFFHIVFDRAVNEPLAFGWACHTGLGQFVGSA